MLSKKFWFLGLFVACCLVLIPLFHSGFVITDDGNWMVIRLSAFYQSFREGQFPVRFLGRLNNSYGYPVANFLYPGFLYLGSIIHLVGIPFVLTVKLIITGSVLTGSFFVFLWLRKHTTPTAAFLGSIVYVFSPYLLFDIYKRGSLGEIVAFAVVTVILYCVDARRYSVLALAFALLIVSHNSIALVFILFFGALFLVRKDKKAFIALGLGIGLTTFFWFPALYERKLVGFDTIRIADPRQYFVTGNYLYLLSSIPLLATILFIFFRPKTFSRAYLIGFVSTLILATPISQFVWNFNEFSRLFQFPYRFLSGTVLFGSYFVAKIFDTLPKKIQILSIGVIFLIAFWQLSQNTTHIKYAYFPEEYYTTNEATTTVANEYMPVWVKEISDSRTNDKVVFQEGRGTITLHSANTQHIDATVLALEDSLLQINSIYYPGWGVTVNDAPAKIQYNNPRGLMQFSVAKGKNHMVAEFRETVPRFIADSCSVIAFFLFIIYTVRKKKI